MWFFRPITHLMPYWGKFPLSIEICRSPLLCMIIPSYEICVGLRIRFHLVMTLRWTFPWFISSGSYFPMSLWFLDGVVSGSWTLTSSFRQSTHESLGQIGYIWRHTEAYFPYLNMEMIVLSQVYYSFHHLVERYCTRFNGHYSFDFH